MVQLLCNAFFDHWSVEETGDGKTGRIKWRRCDGHPSQFRQGEASSLEMLSLLLLLSVFDLCNNMLLSSLVAVVTKSAHHFMRLFVLCRLNRRWPSPAIALPWRPIAGARPDGAALAASRASPTRATTARVATAVHALPWQRASTATAARRTTVARVRPVSSGSTASRRSMSVHRSHAETVSFGVFFLGFVGLYYVRCHRIRDITANETSYRKDLWEIFVLRAESKKIAAISAKSCPPRSSNLRDLPAVIWIIVAL